MAEKISTPQNDLLYDFTKAERKKVEDLLKREGIKLRPFIRKLIRKELQNG